MRANPGLAKIEMEMIGILYGAMDIFSEAYSLRVDGESIGIGDSDGVRIVPKDSGDGIDVYVDAGLLGGRVHVPVIISKTGVVDRVVNDFHIGAGAQVVIMAGCGIHNGAQHATQHDGTHRFFIGKGAMVRYVENHIGIGGDVGSRIMNPVSEVSLGEGSLFEMDTTQIRGVSFSCRETRVALGESSRLLVREKILTEATDEARTNFLVEINGKNAKASISSRAVARGKSIQEFRVAMNANERCMGHSECDGIIADEAKIRAIPEVSANHKEAQLVHEAAIGRIAGEQIDKLMTLGLSRSEAETKIIDGFLR